MSKLTIVEKIKEVEYPKLVDRLSGDSRYIVEEDKISLSGDFYQKQERKIGRAHV